LLSKELWNGHILPSFGNRFAFSLLCCDINVTTSHLLREFLCLLIDS
jgi:hypothetical protein